MSNESLNIDVDKIVKHWIDTSDEDFKTMLSFIDIAVVFKDYSNLIDMQLELMRLR